MGCCVEISQTTRTVKVLSIVATGLVYLGSGLALLFVVQVGDDTILANLNVLGWGMSLALVGAFIKGWVNAS